MTSKKTATAATTTVRPACKYPGCGQPAAPADNPGRPPEYCAGRGHTRVSAWRERRRLAAEKNGTVISPADDASPVTMAKMTGAELLRSLRAEADRISALGTDLRDRIDTLTDPTAEVEAVRAAAEQMSEELTAAQDRASAAEQRAQAAEADRDAAVAQARADAEARIAEAPRPCCTGARTCRPATVGWRTRCGSSRTWASRQTRRSRTGTWTTPGRASPERSRRTSRRA